MLFSLKETDKNKFKEDGKWFKDYMNYVSPSTSPSIDHYEEMKNAYELVNMDLSSLKDKIGLFCNPLSDIVDELEEQLDPLADLKIKVEVLKGESLKRNDEFKVVLVTDRAIKAKNDLQKQLTQQSIDELVGLKIKALESELKGMPQEEAQKLIQDLRSQNEPEDINQKNWLSDLEIIFSKILKHTYLKYDIKNMMADTLEDAVIADRFYVFNTWKNGKPTIEIRNPLHGQGSKDPNNPFIHKGAWFWYRKAITIQEAIATYNLSNEEVDNLYSYSLGLDKRHGIGGDPIPSDNLDIIATFQGPNIPNDKFTGLAQTQETNNVRDGLIFETHFEFVAFKEVLFLSYRDEYGKQITEIVTDFEIPKDAVKETFFNKFDQKTERFVWFDKDLNTEFEAERIWIPRLYEIVRLGDDIYPYYREVPYQTINPENPFEISLSTKGIIINARNSKYVSSVQRAIPLYLQLLFVHHVQNRELSKYQGFIHSIDMDQIPDGLALDENGKQIRDKVGAYLSVLRKTNKDLFSGTQTTTGGLAPSTRSPGSSGFMLGTAIELMNLQQLKDLIKREIGMAMGISPQREAAFTRGSNVSDNQQAIVQSHTITEPLFYKHAIVWKDVLSDHLNAYRQYYQKMFDVFNVKELSEHIWLPEGSQETLLITPDTLVNADLGLFLTNTQKTEEYSKIMLQQSFAFAQNQGQGIEAVSQLIKDIVSGASPEEIHKRISILEEQSFKRQQQLQEQQDQAQQQLKQMEIEAREDQQKHEEQLIKIKGQLDLEKELIRASFVDQNRDGIPDQNEAVKIQIENRKLDLKEREIQVKKEIEEKKIKNTKTKSTKS